MHIDLSGTGVGDDVVPSVFSLSPCHPNPFTAGLYDETGASGSRAG